MALFEYDDLKLLEADLDDIQKYITVLEIITKR